MTDTLALDTSVALPLVLDRHEAHDEVVRWWAGRPVALCGHAAPETYSVLTRLPSPLRVTPADAAALLRARFGDPLVLPAHESQQLVERLATAGITGGAVHDAMVAFSAVAHSVALATRDARARPTYERLGAQVVVVA